MAEKKDIKVRVLTALEVDGVAYQVDDVVSFPAAVVAALKQHTAVDDDKAAVSYAMSLKGSAE